MITFFDNIQRVIFNLLKHIDLFGVSINIRFQDQEKYKTRFGGLFSILLISAMFILTANVIIQVFFKVKPQVIVEDVIISNPQKYHLTRENFSFSIGLFDQVNYKPFIDASYFTIEADFMIKQKYTDENGQTQSQLNPYKIKIKPCKSEDFQVQDTEDYFLSLDYTNLFCLDYNQDLYIEGQFDADEFSVIEIKIKQCAGPNCKDEGEIQRRLKNTFMQIYYTTQVVQPTNYENAYKNIGQTQFYYTNLQQSSAINMKYMNSYVVDTIGILGTEQKQQRALIFSQDRLLYSNNQDLYLISIFLEKNKERYYYRSYISIKDAFTQIGGTFNFLFLLGSIICQPYSKVQLQRKLLNSMFSFQTNDSKQTKQVNQITEKSSKKLEAQTVSQQSLPIKKQRIYKRKETNNSKINISMTEDNIKEESIKRIFQNNLEVAKIKTKEFFMLIFQKFSFKKSEKFEMVQLGKEKVYQYTDISFIINKLIEFEKIKHLILENDQIKLFEFIPKPKLQSIYSEAKKFVNSPALSINNFKLQRRESIYIQPQQEEINILSIENKDMKFKAQQAQDAFNQIYKNKSKQSKIDKKLITMLDKELINYLQMQPSLLNIYQSCQTPRREKTYVKNNEDLSYFSLLKQSLECKGTQYQEITVNYKESTYKNKIVNCESISLDESETSDSNQSQNAQGIHITRQMPSPFLQ